jgi:DNA polymerase III epsilon subunit-like protein
VRQLALRGPIPEKVMKTTTQVFLDIETSGGTQHRVIELALITRIVGPRGKVHQREEWHELFDISPDKVQPYVTWKVHGIKNSHLVYQKPFREHLPFITKRLGEADVVIAHSFASDRSWLTNEFALHNQRLPAITWECTRELAYASGLPGALGELTLHFKVEQRGAGHRALPDARRCEAVFDCLIKGPKR